MAHAIKESVKNLLFFLISNVFFDVSCCFILMVLRGSILNAGRSLLKDLKNNILSNDISREKKLVIFCCEV